MVLFDHTSGVLSDSVALKLFVKYRRAITATRKLGWIPAAQGLNRPPRWGRADEPGQRHIESDKYALKMVGPEGLEPSTKGFTVPTHF